jgi:hypothetical protein
MSPVEIMIKEYESLRKEVLGRIKIAFSHLGYFGAVVAFGFPASKDVSGDEQLLAQVLVVAGAVILVYISILNWFWISRLADHLRFLEKEINRHAAADTPLLSWEGVVKTITRPRKFTLPPPNRRESGIRRGGYPSGTHVS